MPVHHGGCLQSPRGHRVLPEKRLRANQGGGFFQTRDIRDRLHVLPTDGVAGRSTSLRTESCTDFQIRSLIVDSTPTQLWMPPAPGMPAEWPGTPAAGRGPAGSPVPPWSKTTGIQTDVRTQHLASQNQGNRTVLDHGGEAPKCPLPDLSSTHWVRTPGRARVSFLRSTPERPCTPHESPGART